MIGVPEAYTTGTDRDRGLDLRVDARLIRGRVGRGSVGIVCGRVGHHIRLVPQLLGEKDVAAAHVKQLVVQVARAILAEPVVVGLEGVRCVGVVTLGTPEQAGPVGEIEEANRSRPARRPAPLHGVSVIGAVWLDPHIMPPIPALLEVLWSGPPPHVGGEEPELA